MRAVEILEITGRTPTELRHEWESREGPYALTAVGLTWDRAALLERAESRVHRELEEGLVEAHRHVFGVMFWFILLPGPAGAVLYRLSALLYEKWGTRSDEEYGRFGRFARRAFEVIDWIPSRLTAMSFAVAGDFEDALYCWRQQAQSWMNPEQGIVLAAGAGALGVRLGETIHQHGTVSFRPELGVGDEADVDYMTSAVGLIWRSVVIWMLVIAIVTAAFYAGG